MTIARGAAIRPGWELDPAGLTLSMVGGSCLLAWSKQCFAGKFSMNNHCQLSHACWTVTDV